MAVIITRYDVIDFIKCFAIIGVVCGHTNPFWDMSEPVYFVIDTLPKVAVTYFFVSAGFLYGRKIRERGGCDNYFRRYAQKIAQLYFGWTLFYFVYDCGVNIYKAHISHSAFHSELQAFSGFISVAKIAADIFYFGYAGIHLWFLIALLWSMMILHVVVKANKLNMLLGLSLILNIIGLFGGSYEGVFPLPLPTRNALFYGLFYCTLGCYFALNEEDIRRKLAGVRPVSLLIVLGIFTVLQMVERAILIKYFEGDILDDYVLTSIPLAITLFLLVMRKPNFGAGTVFVKIGQNALGVYVIHFFIKECASYALVDKLGLNANTIIYQLLFTPLVFMVSYWGYKFLHYFWAFVNEYAERADILHLPRS